MSSWLKTPAIDRLAREGLRFARCITQSPGCIPARVALMTGLYPHNTAVWNNRKFTLPASARTWVRCIRDVGYHTAIVGKTHLHHQSGDLRDRRSVVQAWGFEDVMEIPGPRAAAHCRSELADEWERAGVLEAYVADLTSRSGEGHFAVRPSPVGLDLHYDTFVGRNAVDQIKAFGRERPWFCWVGFAGPHEPWDAPEPYASMYTRHDVPDPLPAIASSGFQRPRGRLLDERLESDARRLGHLTGDDVLDLRAGYAAKVSLIDDQIAGILAAVEERGDLESTLVVLTSDHGEMNGDHGLMHKSTFLEGAVTVPLIVRPPGAKAGGGRLVAGVVELNDVGPTLAEAAGCPVDHPQWGRSLWAIVTRGADATRRVAVSEQSGEIMITDDRWKVALNRDGDVYLCTDVENDPTERTNLAGHRSASGTEAVLRELALTRLLSTQLYDDWS